jgi:hypothetical protein
VRAVGRGRVPESRECGCGERRPLSIEVTCVVVVSMFLDVSERLSRSRIFSFHNSRGDMWGWSHGE